MLIHKSVELQKAPIRPNCTIYYVLLSFLLFLLPSIGFAQINVPDEKFRAVLMEEYKITFDEKNNITNPDQTSRITDLDLDGIDNITGIEAFQELKVLKISNLSRGDLPILNINLERLDITSSWFLSLDFSQCTQLRVLNLNHIITRHGFSLNNINVSMHTQLRVLNLADNTLTSLDVSKNPQLQVLNLADNELTSLDVSKNTQLQVLNLGDSLDTRNRRNHLTSLDVSKNTQLRVLNLYSSLTSLDVSKNTHLRVLNLDSYFYSRLTSLDVSKNTQLQVLNLANTSLTSLDISKNTQLRDLDLSGNKITSLEVSKNTQLLYLNLADNELTSLDVSMNTDLENLSLDGNKLTSIDISKNTQLRDLDLSDNELTSLDVSKNIQLRNFSPEIMKTVSKETVSKETVSKNNFSEITLFVYFMGVILLMIMKDNQTIENRFWKISSRRNRKLNAHIIQLFWSPFVLMFLLLIISIFSIDIAPAPSGSTLLTNAFMSGMEQFGSMSYLFGLGVIVSMIIHLRAVFVKLSILNKQRILKKGRG